MKTPWSDLVNYGIGVATVLVLCIGGIIILSIVGVVVLILKFLMVIR